MKYLVQSSKLGGERKREINCVVNLAFYLFNILESVKMLFERSVHSVYSNEKSTLACYSRSQCFSNEQRDQMENEFGTDSVFPHPLYDPIQWEWELTGFSVGRGLVQITIWM